MQIDLDAQTACACYLRDGDDRILAVSYRGLRVRFRRSRSIARVRIVLMLELGPDAEVTEGITAARMLEDEIEAMSAHERLALYAAVEGMADAD